jgi:hypothetical protein
MEIPDLMTCTMPWRLDCIPRKHLRAAVRAVPLLLLLFASPRLIAQILTTVNPNTGQQGQLNESVSLTGQSTHWVQGTTTASFGAGITVATLTINSATSATAVLNIDPAAAGARNVTVTTGGEVVTLNNGFTVLSVVLLPTITKQFADSQIQLFGPSNSTALSFTIMNPNTITTLTGLAFTDTLPSGLIVSTPNGLTGSCGGTIMAIAGSNSISLSGGTLAPSASCTFSVNVTGTEIGVQTNTTSTVTSNEAPPGAPATATTSVDDLFFFWFFAA